MGGGSRGCIRVIFCCFVVVFCGCSVMERSDEGAYQRLKFEPVRSGVSLYEVISNVAGRFDDSREQAAALDAYQGCRTNAVFDKYHVRQLYLSLRERLESLGAKLIHEKGYVYVAIPAHHNEPDANTLRQFASIVGENQRVHVFIPKQSPFGDVNEREYFISIKRKLADLGIGKDHVLILPTDLFQAPEGLMASNSAVTVKLCYGWKDRWYVSSKPYLYYGMLQY